MDAHRSEQSKTLVEAWCELAGVEIIPADMKHMRGVMKLVSKTRQSLPSNTTVRSIAEGRLFVALIDNLMVGFIEFEVFHRDVWTISRMSVAKPVRNHGIGSALVATIIEEAHSIGKTVSVAVPENDGSLDFFIKNYFTFKEITKANNGENQFVMERPPRWH